MNPSQFAITIEKAVWFTTHEDIAKTFSKNTLLLERLRDSIANGSFTITTTPSDDSLLESITCEGKRILKDLIDKAARADAPFTALSGSTLSLTETLSSSSTDSDSVSSNTSWFGS